MVKIKSIKQEFLDLFRLSFRHEMSQELWEWKYVRNPFVDDDYEIVVALDKGNVVGARSFLPAEMWINERMVKAAQPCDTMVHPEYRRRGLFRRMNELAIQFLDTKGYALFYNFPGPMLLPFYRTEVAQKQGWRIISSVENLFRVTNPRRVISYKLGNRFLGIGLGLLYRLFLGTGQKNATPSRTEFQVRVSNDFSDELKDIDSLADRSSIDLVRSEAYLKWRFDMHPEHRYRYITVRDRDELLGYAVISTQKHPPNLDHIVIIDYALKHNNTDCFQELMGRLLHEAQDPQPDFISAWALGHDNFRTELIEKYGFKSSLDFPYRRLFEKQHFVVRKASSQVIGDIDIYNARNWRVSRAYLDVA